MYLLDTIVLSELRRKERNRGVVNWIAGQGSIDLFLSVVTIDLFPLSWIWSRGTGFLVRWGLS